MMREDISEWQRAFYAGPQIWHVQDRDGNPTNYYESKEAAECEIAFYRSRGVRGFSIHCAQIHSLKLARERWGETPGGSPGGGAA